MINGTRRVAIPRYLLEEMFNAHFKEKWDGIVSLQIPPGKAKVFLSTGSGAGFQRTELHMEMNDTIGFQWELEEEEEKAVDST